MPSPPSNLSLSPNPLRVLAPLLPVSTLAEALPVPDVAGAGECQVFEIGAEVVTDARENQIDAALRIAELSFALSPMLSTM